MTPSALKAALPRAPLSWLEAVCTVLAGSEIDTPEEQASFIAQLAHESAEFTRLQENLNYSAERLMAVWPSRFKDRATADRYARNPEKLANLVYAGRLGNILPGDGWKYRGRGPIQLTGRSNYTECGKAIGLPLLENPDLLLEPEPGIRSALWFWRAKKLDKLDDDTDVKSESRLVNGGEHGIAERQKYFEAAIKVLRA